MRSQEIKDLWKKVFGQTFRLIKQKYSILDEEIANALCADLSTIRKWKSQNKPNVPSAMYWEKQIEAQMTFCEFLQSKIKIQSTETHNEFKKQIKLILEENNCISNFDDLIYIDDSEYAVSVIKRIYDNYKCNTNPQAITYIESIVQNPAIQALILDFDGTLTIEDSNRKTTWESIWANLGYSLDECRYLYHQYSKNEISRHEWFQLTQEKFINARLTLDTLDEIADNIKFINNIEEGFKYCWNNDIKIYIVSGSIMRIIQKSLGNLCKYVDRISANTMFFDENKKLYKLIETEYDFEGKTTFINNIIRETGINPKNTFYIGNSSNDKHVYKSGINTICINPHLTDPYDHMWNFSITNCNDFMDIIKFIKTISSK